MTALGWTPHLISGLKNLFIHLTNERRAFATVIIHFWFENDLEVDTAVKTDVPILINSTTPEDAVTAPITSYKPFNLPYTAIISLEEC